VAVPVIFGALTVIGHFTSPQHAKHSARRVSGKVFGAAVYIYSLAVVLMAPLNHTLKLGAPRVAFTRCR
jgi:hypothetical protein